MPYFKFGKTRKFILTSLITGAISVACLLFFVSPLESRNNLSDRLLIQLTNDERLKYNLKPLSPNPLLNLAAENKAKDLLKNNYFSHNSPDGKGFSDWVKETNYQYTIVGENLATGFSSGEAVIKAWMKSSNHKKNILNQQYKEIGLAVAKGRLNGQMTYVIVQYFGANDNYIISENLFFFDKETLPSKILV